MNVGLANHVGDLHPEDSYRRTLPTDLAAALDEARRRQGITLRQLGILTGRHRAYLARLCQGSRCPSPDTAEALIAALRLDDDTARWLREVAADRPEGGLSGR